MQEITHKIWEYPLFLFQVLIAQIIIPWQVTNLINILELREYLNTGQSIFIMNKKGFVHFLGIKIMLIFFPSSFYPNWTTSKAWQNI